MESLRFACRPGCTNCCQERGYVYLAEGDLERAAAYLRMTPSAFEKKYVYRTRHLLRLRKPRGSQCHFLRPVGCAIHPVKPHQCRAFPFWPELISSRDSWREAAHYCPGIGAGPPVSFDAVLRIANDMRESYPDLYEGGNPARWR